MHLVQKDLDRIKAEWNCHRIRESRLSCCPSGYPNELYQLPQLLGIILVGHLYPQVFLTSLLIGTKDYSYPVDPRDTSVAKEYTEEPDPPGSLEFLELALEIMTQHHLFTVQEALELYVSLTTIIQSEISDH